MIEDFLETKIKKEGGITVTLTEMWEEVKKIYDTNEDSYNYIGIRFEDKSRKIGDTCECSKHNTNREDERDFPEFGSEEYNSMFTFNGTSAWNLSQKEVYKVDKFYAEKDCTRAFLQDHAYIIAGDYITNMDDALDYNEIVIEDAKVITIIF